MTSDVQDFRSKTRNFWKKTKKSKQTKKYRFPSFLFVKTPVIANMPTLPPPYGSIYFTLPFTIRTCTAFLNSLNTHLIRCQDECHGFQMFPPLSVFFYKIAVLLLLILVPLMCLILAYFSNYFQRHRHHRASYDRHIEIRTRSRNFGLRQNP